MAWDSNFSGQRARHVALMPTTLFLLQPSKLSEKRLLRVTEAINVGVVTEGRICSNPSLLRKQKWLQLVHEN